MAMIPIADQTLLSAIIRIRAGETLNVVARSLHIDPERLSRQLRAAFSDFEALMRAHSGHRPRRSEAQAKPRKTRTRRTFNPGFLSRAQRAERQRGYKDLLQILRAQKRIRVREDFSAEELAALQAKAARVLTEHRGLNISPSPTDANGGVGF